MYREEVAKKLIKSIIPQRLDIGTGFIITATGKISTQCDLIIYDRNNCPLIENENFQRFFPIECVVAIGEIKSNLSKAGLKEALIKLKNNALLRNEIDSDNYYIFNDGKYNEFNPKNNTGDRLMTFLICNKFEFKCDDLVNEMDEIYDGCEKYLRHNMILSIDDGTFMYKEKFSDTGIYYPEIKDVEILNTLVRPEEADSYKYGHIIDFLNYVFMCVASVSIMYPEITNYLSEMRERENIDENV